MKSLVIYDDGKEEYRLDDVQIAIGTVLSAKNGEHYYFCTAEGTPRQMLCTCIANVEHTARVAEHVKKASDKMKGDA